MLKKLKLAYSNYAEGASYPYDENGVLLKNPPKPNIFEFVFLEIKWFFVTLGRRIHGHDLEEEVLNADCGHTHMERRRCGKSWSHYM